MRLNKNNLLVARIASQAKDPSALSAVHMTNLFTEASDGINLVRVFAPSQQDLASEHEASRPVDCLIAAEILKKTPDADMIVVKQDEKSCTFEFGRTSLISPRIDLKYPDTDWVFAEVIGHVPEYEITLSPRALIAVCRIAAALGDQVTLTFRGKTSAIHLEAGDDTQRMEALLSPMRSSKEPGWAGLPMPTSEPPGSTGAGGSTKEPGPAPHKKRYRLDTSKKNKV